MLEEQMANPNLENMTPEQIMELQKQQCVFCKIIKGEIPSKKVYEDNICIAILDINPANIGHMLLLPKNHYTILPQVPENEIKHMAAIAKQLSHSALKAFGAEGTNIFIANGALAGQRAPHFMIHIIPRKEKDGVEGFEIPEHKISDKDAEQIQKIISEKLSGKKEAKEKPAETKKADEKIKEGKKEIKKEEEKPKTKEKKKDIDVDINTIAKMFKK